MMNAKVRDLLNQQINKEFYSAYLYLDFSNYFEDAGLDGFANWYKVQAQEERDHAMLFYQYLQNENQKVTLEAIAKPDKVFTCHMDVLKAGLEHEEYVTSLINDIYAAAYEVKDFRTMQFLDWFVKEQGEEETNANDMITKMELFGSDPKSLYMLNQELAARVYTAPSLVLLYAIRRQTMKYVCDVCGWEYDEELGDPDNGIEPGTKFEDLPENFECPLCGVGKDNFSEVE